MTHDLDLLQAARIGYQHKVAEIDALILQQVSKSQPQKRQITAVEESEPPKRKINMSAEGRKRIADASKKRWAEFRAKKGKTGSAAA